MLFISIVSTIHIGLLYKLLFTDVSTYYLLHNSQWVVNVHAYLWQVKGHAINNRRRGNTLAVVEVCYSYTTHCELWHTYQQTT